jgi:hypothetical protein
MEKCSITGLQKAEDYVSARSDAFPSIHAYEWWERQNRRALVSAGALVFIGRRKFVDPIKADKVVVEAGIARARRATP